jgi:hypothetical protein
MDEFVPIPIFEILAAAARPKRTHDGLGDSETVIEDTDDEEIDVRAMAKRIKTGKSTNNCIEKCNQSYH